jgi:hypothetical protein
MMRISLPISPRDPSRWKMELGILASLVMACATVRASKFGKTLHSIKGFGSTIAQMAEEDSYMQTVMSTRASGRTIKLMAMESIQESMARVIMGNGPKTCNMDLELRNGMMAHPMKENTFRALSKDMVNLLGPMAQSTKGTSRRI